MGVGTGVATQNGKETPGMLYVSPLWPLFALLSNVLGVSLYHLRSILLDHGECTYLQEMVHLQLC